MWHHKHLCSQHHAELHSQHSECILDCLMQLTFWRTRLLIVGGLHPPNTASPVLVQQKHSYVQQYHYIKTSSPLQLCSTSLNSSFFSCSLMLTPQPSCPELQSMFSIVSFSVAVSLALPAFLPCFRSSRLRRSLSSFSLVTTTLDGSTPTCTVAPVNICRLLCLSINAT
jgi:hypothetical protein